MEGYLLKEKKYKKPLGGLRAEALGLFGVVVGSALLCWTRQPYDIHEAWFTTL